MIPSLVGRMPLGKSESHPLAETGGSETVTLTTAQMPSHNHSVSVSILENGEHSHTIRSGTGSGSNTKALTTIYNITENSSVAPSGNHTHSTSISESLVGNNNAHPNMPPYISLNMIIKT